MANLKEVLIEAMEIKWKIDSLLRLSTYNDYDDLSGLDIDYNSAEELFLWDELKVIMKEFHDIQDKLSYISMPITEISRLSRNKFNGYETYRGHAYACGSCIEALVFDKRHDSPYWTRTSVEHDDSDYYLVGHKEVHMDGLTVRVREAV